MDKWLKDVELKGDSVTLLPLVKEDREGLLAAAGDGELWKLWFTSVPSDVSIDQYIETALGNKESGLALPFTVRLNSTGKIIGSTRYCNVDEANQRLEIGYTWYAQSHQRTAVNTECKFLLLSEAFEELSCSAVEFRTHWHNFASRRAIARLGAQQDGVLRNHMRNPDGSYRDTVVFSIIESEWPTVKKGLEFRMVV